MKTPKKRKKKVFSENRSLTFFPTITLRCTPIQIIGRGDADVDHSQTIGGDTAKLLGGYIPPSPLFRHHCFLHWLRFFVNFVFIFLCLILLSFFLYYVTFNIPIPFCLIFAVFLQGILCYANCQCCLRPCFG